MSLTMFVCFLLFFSCVFIPSYLPSSLDPHHPFQYNISDEDYFGNYFQYILIGMIGNLQTLRTPVDKSV